MVKLSRGTISRKTWKYCETHQTMILKSGPCAEAKCKGKGRERFEFCFTYVGDDGVKRRARGQAPSKGEAEAAMDARKADLSREPEPVVAPPITLNEYAETTCITGGVTHEHIRAVRRDAGPGDLCRRGARPNAAPATGRRRPRNRRTRSRVESRISIRTSASS
jgi:hypothetical protein